MKDRTKRTLQNLLYSQFKNDSAVDGAKTAPWYVALIIALLGTFIPVIPLMVSVSKSYGASFIATQSFGFEKYETALSLELQEAGYDFKINDSKQLLKYKNDVYEETPKALATETKPVARYIDVNADGKEVIAFEMFYSERTAKGTTDTAIKTLSNAILATTYYVDTTYAKGSEEGDAYQSEIVSTMGEGITFTYYRPSFMLLFKDGLYVYLAKPNTTEKLKDLSGDWGHTARNEGILKRMLAVSEIPVSYEKDANGDYLLVRNSEYVKGVKTNFNKLYNESYENAKTRTFWMYCGIFYGVYVVLVFFMGLMLFLLSRGKNNPMNYLTYVTCVKIAAWATFAPGLLAMIFGFLLANYATMFFIILYGLRIMWLSMRTLRPQAQ